MLTYNKTEIKEQITLEDVFNILVEWGGDPEYTSFGILASTICHNPPGEGSRKLYYYENSGLFKCYTDCDCAFDIFELTIKVALIQSNRQMDLNDAVRYIAYKFNIAGTSIEDDDVGLLDWQYLNNYDKISEIDIKKQEVRLKEYDSNVANNLCKCGCRIDPWLKEGISQAAMDHAHIGYLFSTDQISIPHYDKERRLVGLRGRTMSKEEAEQFGKYRPIKINGKMYNHPLGYNLYNLNNSQDNIRIIGKAIVFEAEKSCLLYQSYFGFENDISVACCGSSLSSFQMQMLLDAGAKEVIIAFDRQFQEIGDIEFKRLTKKLTAIDQKYKNEVVVSFIFDKKMITGYKASPIDEGKEKFLKLFKERIIL